MPHQIMDILSCPQAFQVALVVKNPIANVGDIRDEGLIPGLGRSPGGEHGNPLQYSCLKKPMEKGAWRATVHGVQGVRHNWSGLACIHIWVTHKLTLFPHYRIYEYLFLKGKNLILLIFFTKVHVKSLQVHTFLHVFFHSLFSDLNPWLLEKIFFSPQVILVNFSISFSGFRHLRKLHLGQWVPAAEKNLLECCFDLAWPFLASSCQRSSRIQSKGSTRAQTSDYMSKAIFLKCLPGQAGRRFSGSWPPVRSIYFWSGLWERPPDVFKKVPAFTCLLPQSLGCQPPGGVYWAEFYSELIYSWN